MESRYRPHQRSRTARHLLQVGRRLLKRDLTQGVRVLLGALKEAEQEQVAEVQWDVLACLMPVALTLGMYHWMASQAGQVTRLAEQFASPHHRCQMLSMLGTAYLRLGQLSRSASYHEQALHLAQELDVAELAYALYTSSFGFNEFHHPGRALELSEEMLALDLSGVPLAAQHKVQAYAYLSCAVGHLYLADHQQMLGNPVEAWAEAEAGLKALRQLEALPPVEDDPTVVLRAVYIEIRLLELGLPSAEAEARLRSLILSWAQAPGQSNPRHQQRYLVMLGRLAARQGQAALVHHQFGSALDILKGLPLDFTLSLRTHRAYSESARQIGDLTTALEQMEEYARLLLLRQHQQADQTIEELAARFQLARAAQESRAAAQQTQELLRILAQRDSAIKDEQVQTLERLATVAEYRDQDSRAHIHWVGEVAASVAALMQQPEEFVTALRVAARLHDIGKVVLPDDILLKNGPLTAQEMQVVQTHTTIGAGMLDVPGHPLLGLAAQVALTHHERWDGQGYPAGLQGTDIPLAGRIVSVVDVYDALRATRPYKASWTVDKALAYVQGEAGSRFDPAVVEAFVQLHRLGALPWRRDGTSKESRP